MGGLFSRVKNWLSLQNLTDTDLNAEFNNIISNLGASTISGASATVPGMQTTLNPGNVGSEVQAANIAQELQELRYQIQALSGGAQWYVPPVASVSSLNTLFSSLSTLPSNRIVSGRQYSSLQPGFLVPSGSTNSLQLKATITPLVTVIQGTTTTFSSDISLPGLSLAPSTGNTATVLDATLSGNQASRTQGERSTLIQIGSVGSNISSLTGKYAAFKTGTEYFIGEVSINSATTSCTFSALGIVNAASITPTSFVGIPAGTTISSFTATTITMSANATASGTVSVGIVTGGIGYAVTATITNGSPTMTAVTSTGIVTATAHGLTSGDQVTFAGGSLPSGVVAGTIYFAYPIDANTFKLSTTAGGSFINTGMASGSGTVAALKNNCLKNCYRGFFFNSSDVAISRATLSNGATITLMQMGWIFATNNASVPSLDVSYNKPYVGASQPTSPASGDYWLDLTVNQWKKYSGTLWTAQTAILIGAVVIDTSACVGARSFEFFTYYNAVNTIEPSYQDTATLRSAKLSQAVSVNGTTYNFNNDLVKWSTATNLDSGESLSVSTTYYAYISSLGVPFLSTIAPYQRRFDLLGDYHPHKPYRCVGQAATDGSSLLTSSSVSFYDFMQTRLPSSIIQPGMLSSAIIDSSLQLNSSGQLGLAPLGVAQSMRAASNYGQSSSCGSFTTTSTTPVFITNLSITITTNGRPVYIGLQPDGLTTFGGTAAVVGVSKVAATSCFAVFGFYRDGLNISYSEYGFSDAVGAANLNFLVPVNALFFIDKNAAAGTHTYDLKVANNGSETVSITNCVLYAYEL